MKQIFERNPSSSKGWLHIHCTTSLRCSFCRCTFSSSSCLRDFLLWWKLHEFYPASLFTDNLLLEFNDFKSLFFTNDVSGIGSSLELANLKLNILILFTVGLKSAKLRLKLLNLLMSVLIDEFDAWLLVNVFGSPLELRLFIEKIPLLLEFPLFLLLFLLFTLLPLQFLFRWLLWAASLLGILCGCRWLLSSTLDIGSCSLLRFFFFGELACKNLCALHVHAADLQFILVALFGWVVFL